MLRFICVVIISCMPFAAPAAICDAGYRLTDGECKRCGSGIYCPDENTVIQCPLDTADWYTIYTNIGYEVLHITSPAYYSWGTGGAGASAITHCHLGFHVTTSIGTFYTEPRFGGTAYDREASSLWYNAATGYYLSPYSWTSGNNWYRGTKPCTNAPDNAHYTGSGTPDAPDGSIKDANDCPWECDDGYGLHGTECVPLCGTGIQYIKTGGGLMVNLYPIRYSSPALHVRHNGTICYGILAPGVTKNTININVAGALYHLEN